MGNKIITRMVEDATVKVSTMQAVYDGLIKPGSILYLPGFMTKDNKIWRRCLCVKVISNDEVEYISGSTGKMFDDCNFKPGHRFTNLKSHPCFSYNTQIRDTACYDKYDSKEGSIFTLGDRSDPIGKFIV